MKQKDVFLNILIVMAILLLVLPLIVTFSAFLTSLFNRMGWYIWLQESVVPFESRLVGVLIRPLGIIAQLTGRNDFPMLLVKGNSFIPVSLEWNCLGWQSMLLLVLTFITGLRGNYTYLSRFQVILLGVLGTFLSNLLRMALIVAFAYYWNQAAALIIHDYFASLVAICWMLFFWWFSFKFVLEEAQH